MDETSPHNLAKIPIGVTTELVAIKSSYPHQRFLQELGFTENCQITVLRKAPFGDPLHVRVRNSEFALLKADAENIFVKVLS